MAKQAFINKNFQRASLELIAMADAIINEYQEQGFTLTLRQLYYQFVARDIIPNTEKSYKRLGKIINDARMAGYLDWSAIEDRTRSLTSWVRRVNPKQAIELARGSYGIDMWLNQSRRVEVWVEKEALAGVIHNICGEWDVPYFSCRGYVSQSEQYAAGRRFKLHHHKSGQSTVVLHLGDHDPSGIDMTRDNDDRLSMFSGRADVEVRRIALNRDQIDEYNPPPNPAKVTDARFEQYSMIYGDESWELDALEPSVLVDLIRDHIDDIRDFDLWAEREAKLEEDLATFDRIIGELE